jgi:hypothetical protein
MGAPQAGQGRRDVISQFFGTMMQAYCRPGAGDRVGGWKIRSANKTTRCGAFRADA